MDIWRKITVEKSLRYLFLLFSIGAGLLALLNLGAYLGIGQEGSTIRGWVHYGMSSNQPEPLSMENGVISIHNMNQHRFAVVHFDHLTDMLQGIPLVYLLFQLLIDLAIVVIFFQLMHIFRSLDRGEVFRDNNLTRIRRIAYAVVAFSVLTFLNTNLLAMYIQGSGDTYRGAYPVLTIERVVLGLLVAFVIMSLVKAFKIGTQLQQEQDLTI